MKSILCERAGRLSMVLCVLALGLSLFTCPKATKAVGNLGKGKAYKETKIAPPKGYYYWNVGGLPQIFLIDMGKGKIIKKYSRKYTSLCGTDGKHIYVTSGSIAAETEKIVKLKASSGKRVSAISTRKIRALAEDRTEKNESQKFCKDEPFDTCYSGGKLYLRYLTGIYTWNEKKKRFDTVLDGIENKNYTTGQLDSEYFRGIEVVGKKIYVFNHSDVYMYSL